MATTDINKPAPSTGSSTNLMLWALGVIVVIAAVYFLINATTNPDRDAMNPASMSDRAGTGPTMTSDQPAATDNNNATGTNY